MKIRTLLKKMNEKGIITNEVINRSNVKKTEAYLVNLLNGYHTVIDLRSKGFVNCGFVKSLYSYIDIVQDWLINYRTTKEVL